MFEPDIRQFQVVFLNNCRQRNIRVCRPLVRRYQILVYSLHTLNCRQGLKELIKLCVIGLNQVFYFWQAKAQSLD